MNILILGSGGREHSLAWAVNQNPKCDILYCAPGNAGISKVAQCVDLNIENSSDVLKFCLDESIQFVIIGPEAPLAMGIADDLRANNILTFGPSASAAKLESSKAFTKGVCDSCNAPTAKYARFTELESAIEYVHEQGAPIVVKADGLAGGKGVIVAMTLDEAINGLKDIFSGAFGKAGAEVVIEEFMEGEEASFFILSDGKNILPIGTAQDHKRVFDGDTGPNTGGMGAYSPAPIMTKDVTSKAISQIIQPTIDEMAKRGIPYQGVLYAGFMIKDGEPKLVEYNVRFGDPECQALMMRLGAQALDAMLACAKGELNNYKLNWADDHALTIVYAAKGYPGTYEKGSNILGLDTISESTNIQVFHAGTKEEENNIIATGGRVLNITARGSSLKEAHRLAYETIEKIQWENGFYRNDIGWRAL
ncbi:phosphoribosylamine--glycine ligase [Amylibacter sp.]|nr:Phosphoribosylamine--glycine ligase [alpha proteobacterium HTCC2255] [Rhodobacterales bacterium HTCC2255]MDA8752138.1 phosphoribosylamine--glycine ligase [Amylibacter sp.]MDA8756579.1 phosphoribosylamine--glycine ligase [Amylibacter sp.]MDA9586645.1 phosphoribosylamine--glycine ligase [Amylibacter sp.]MDB2524185.1 phosphoribosylamine--glycine ligase [Amylibacter sp.]